MNEKGFAYSCGFWTDGIIGNKSKRVWSWSYQDYTSFGYFQDTALSNNYKSYMYLSYNGSGYEFDANNGAQKMGFVCEAQGRKSGFYFSKCLNDMKL